jgi:hypothetical protein
MVKHHFFLASATPYQVRLVWSACTLILLLFWDASAMSEDSKIVLVLALRLWVEILNGCTHKSYVLVAFFVMATASGICIKNLTHFGDVIHGSMTLALAAATAKLLLADPKKHVIPGACSAQMLKKRIKTR